MVDFFFGNVELFQHWNHLEFVLEKGLFILDFEQILDSVDFILNQFVEGVNFVRKLIGAEMGSEFFEKVLALVGEIAYFKVFVLVFKFEQIVGPGGFGWEVLGVLEFVFAEDWLKGATAGTDVIDVVDFVGGDFDGFIFEVWGLTGEDIFIIVEFIEGVGFFVMNGSFMIEEGGRVWVVDLLNLGLVDGVDLLESIEPGVGFEFGGTSDLFLGFGAFCGVGGVGHF